MRQRKRETLTSANSCTYAAPTHKREGSQTAPTPSGETCSDSEIKTCLFGQEVEIEDDVSINLEEDESILESEVQPLSSVRLK